MKTRLFTFIRFVVLLIVSLVWAVPLLWALWAAIRPASMVTKFNFDLNLTIENFRYVFELWDFSTYLRNSLLIVIGTLAVQLVTVTLAAYAVSRIDFAGKKLFKNGEFVSVSLRKGGAKDPEHEVDGISGGTKTSDGVTAMLRDCLSAYLPYFESQHQAAAQSAPAAANEAASSEVSNQQNVNESHE